jgi:hypothetical protein
MICVWLWPKPPASEGGRYKKEDAWLNLSQYLAQKLAG